jgi:hypothetical protein
MMGDMLDAPVRDSTAEVAESSDPIRAAYKYKYSFGLCGKFNI